MEVGIKAVVMQRMQAAVCRICSRVNSKNNSLRDNDMEIIIRIGFEKYKIINDSRYFFGNKYVVLCGYN